MCVYLYWCGKFNFVQLSAIVAVSKIKVVKAKAVKQANVILLLGLKQCLKIDPH